MFRLELLKQVARIVFCDPAASRQTRWVRVRVRVGVRVGARARVRVRVLGLGCKG